MEPTKPSEAAAATESPVDAPVPGAGSGRPAGHGGGLSVRGLVGQVRSLQKLLRRRGTSREQAEDLVQEAMLRLHIYTCDGGRVDNPEAFLRRTTMNLAVDAYRHDKPDRYEEQPVENLDLIDVGPTPDEVFAAEQRLFKMKDALDRANSRTREVFFMHRLQGFSHAEIARRMGISVSAVEKHVASAVTLLAIDRQRE